MSAIKSTNMPENSIQIKLFIVNITNRYQNVLAIERKLFERNHKMRQM